MNRVTGERVVMDDDAVRRAVLRLGHEVREHATDRGPPLPGGLRTRGIPRAARLQRQVADLRGEAGALGRLDPSLYRDDLAVARPRLEPTEMPVDLTGRRVVLVDD